jgi:hypothetical protein
MYQGLLNLPHQRGGGLCAKLRTQAAELRDAYRKQS